MTLFVLVVEQFGPAGFEGLVQGVLRGTFGLVLAGVLVIVIGRKAHAAGRHLIWTLGVLFLLVAPMGLLLLPTARVLPDWLEPMPLLAEPDSKTGGRDLRVSDGQRLKTREKLTAVLNQELIDSVLPGTESSGSEVQSRDLTAEGLAKSPTGSDVGEGQVTPAKTPVVAMPAGQTSPTPGAGETSATKSATQPPASHDGTQTDLYDLYIDSPGAKSVDQATYQATDRAGRTLAGGGLAGGESETTAANQRGESRVCPVRFLDSYRDHSKRSRSRGTQVTWKFFLCDLCQGMKVVLMVRIADIGDLATEGTGSAEKDGEKRMDWGEKGESSFCAGA